MPEPRKNPKPETLNLYTGAMQILSLPLPAAPALSVEWPGRIIAGRLFLELPVSSTG